MKSLPTKTYGSSDFEVNVFRLKFMPLRHKEKNTSNTNFLLSQISATSWTTRGFIPISAALSLTVTLRFSLTAHWFFFLFLSVEAVCGRPLWDWPAMSSISFFKILYPSSDTVCERACVFAYNSNSRVNTWYWYYFLTRKSLNALCRNEMSSVVSFFFSEIKYKHVARAGDVIFILVRADKTELLFM